MTVKENITDFINLEGFNRDIDRLKCVLARLDKSKLKKLIETKVGMWLLEKYVSIMIRRYARKATVKRVL